jgi:hypothetical protein
MAESISYASAGRSGTSLVKIGGVLAIAGTIIGTFIFALACFGFNAAFALSIIPTLLGAAGLVLSIWGGLFQHPVGVEDTHVLASLLLSIAVICGGLIEVALWLQVPIFAVGAGPHMGP